MRFQRFGHRQLASNELIFSMRGGLIAPVSFAGGQILRQACVLQLTVQRASMKHIASIGLAACLSLGVGASFLYAASPRVFFIEPQDGAVVISPFKVKFGLEGFALKPAGDATPDSGHHHLIIDGGPVPKDEIIPANEKSIHFGKAQTETQLTLPPGKHTLTLQFGNGGHLSYGPALSSTITVDVKP
ncbi:conserved hypothetical protein [Methylocella tundrae]|nr:conserved hypothetical protein [Methylocella tundrae]